MKDRVKGAQVRTEGAREEGKEGGGVEGKGGGRGKPGYQPVTEQSSGLGAADLPRLAWDGPTDVYLPVNNGVGANRQGRVLQGGQHEEGLGVDHGPEERHTEGQAGKLKARTTHAVL